MNIIIIVIIIIIIIIIIITSPTYYFVVLYCIVNVRKILYNKRHLACKLSRVIFLYLFYKIKVALKGSKIF